MGINPRRDGSPMGVRFAISCHVNLEYARKTDFYFYAAVLVKKIIEYVFLVILSIVGFRRSSVSPTVVCKRAYHAHHQSSSSHRM